MSDWPFAPIRVGSSSSGAAGAGAAGAAAAAVGAAAATAAASPAHSHPPPLARTIAVPMLNHQTRVGLTSTQSNGTPTRENVAGAGAAAGVPAARTAAAAAAAPAAPHVASVPSASPRLSQLRKELKSIDTAFTPPRLSEWLTLKLAPALSRKLPVRQPSLLPEARAQLRADLDRDGSLDRIIEMYRGHTKQAVALLAKLMQPPVDSAVLPTTAKARAAAAHSQTPVQSGAAGGVMNTLKTQLQGELRVIDALVGSEGVLRLLLSEGDSSAAQLSSSQFSVMLSATCPSSVSTASTSQCASAWQLLYLPFARLCSQQAAPSALRVQATFSRLHDLHCASISIQALQLFLQLLPNCKELRGGSAQAAGDRSAIMAMLLRVVQTLNQIADEAAAATRRSAEWREQFERLMPTSVEHVTLLVQVAESLLVMMKIRVARGDGSLHQARAVGSPLSGSSSGSQQQQQEHGGSGSQLASSPVEQLSQPTQPAAEAALSATASAAKSTSTLQLRAHLLELFAQLCRACTLLQETEGVSLMMRQELLLYVFELTHHMLERYKSNPSSLMALLLQQEQHLEPLLSQVLSSAAPHPQLLEWALRILSCTLRSADTERASALARELKAAGIIHVLLAHCRRVTDGQPGSSSNPAVVSALQLLTDVVTRCPHEPWERWTAAYVTMLSRLTTYDWRDECKACAAAIGAGALDAAIVHLSLIAHWLESHTESLLQDADIELDSVPLVTALQDALILHAGTLDKPHLLRVIHLMTLLDRCYGLTLPVAAQRAPFKRCLALPLQPADLALDEWEYVWSTEMTFKEGTSFQQQMVTLYSDLLSPSNTEDPLTHLHECLPRMVRTGVNGMRALMHILQTLVKQLAGGQPPPAYAGSVRQLGNRALAVLLQLTARDETAGDKAACTLRLLLYLKLPDVLVALMQQQWHLTGLFDFPSALLLPSASTTQEQAETDERVLLRTHETIVSLCTALLSQSAIGGRDRVDTAHTLISAILSIFHRHLPSLLPDLRLHVAIVRSLRLVLQHKSRVILLELVKPRSLTVLRWVTSHLPDSSTLIDVHHAHLLLQPLPGLVGLPLTAAKTVQSQQIQLLVELMLLLTQLLPVARHIAADTQLAPDLQERPDVSTLMQVLSMQQLCFLAAQPLLELTGSVFGYLTCCLKEGLVSFEQISEAAAAEEHAPGPLRMGWQEARRLLLAVQAALTTAMASHSQDTSAARAAVEMMEHILQQCPDEWRSRLLRLPWNGFVLEAQLCSVGESSSPSLSASALRFMALLCGWPTDRSEQPLHDVHSVAHSVFKSCCTPTVLHRLTQELTALTQPSHLSTAASSSLPLTIQHALLLLEVLHALGLLRASLVPPTKALLVHLRKAWDACTAHGEVNINSNLHERVALRMERLYNGVAQSQAAVAQQQLQSSATASSAPAHAAPLSHVPDSHMQQPFSPSMASSSSDAPTNSTSSSLDVTPATVPAATASSSLPPPELELEMDTTSSTSNGLVVTAAAAASSSTGSTAGKQGDGSDPKPPIVMSQPEPDLTHSGCSQPMELV